MIVNEHNKVSGSFRDPSGFLFWHEGNLYRQINQIYRDNYDQLMDSGLYNKLVDMDLLIPHTETVLESEEKDSYKIIKPKMIPFISYPYEWSFSQLKDAALTTLDLMKVAFKFGMTLKDASAYNLQFIGNKAIFIDTLSFEIYKIDQPWVAYRQFCQHFLAPLALMSYSDIRLNQLLKTYIDGIPLDLASSLLPYKTKFKPGLATHIHFHAKSQSHYAGQSMNKTNAKFSKMAFQGLIDSLKSVVEKLTWQPDSSAWSRYYEENNYSDQALEHKKQIVSSFIDKKKPAMVWDLGANTGVFSRLTAEKGLDTIAFELDPVCNEINYRECQNEGSSRILPLLQDLSNPSPGIGWNNKERNSLSERGPADLVLALALIHHIAITNNVPFDMIAEFLSEIALSLVIEFVPKEDEQLQRLLDLKEDIFSHYSSEQFVKSFEKYFHIEESVKIADTKRTVYLMVRKT